MARSYRYLHYDVFTDHLFGGNQLAVFLDGRGLKPDTMQAIDNHEFIVIGRLKPGVTQAQAVTDLSLITRRIHDQHLDLPFVSKGANAKPLLESIVGDMKRPLYVLLAATSCVLLIACLNVANLPGGVVEEPNPGQQGLKPNLLDRQASASIELRSRIQDNKD